MKFLSNHFLHKFTALSHFNLKPTITEVGIHQVSISISEALRILTDEDKRHFVRGELQLIKVSSIDCVHL